MTDKDQQPDNEAAVDESQDEGVLEPEVVATEEHADLARDELENLLRAKEQETKDAEDKVLRLAAEMENYKKRMAREKADAIKYANEALVRDLLPVLDNLERAAEHARGHERHRLR